MEKKKMEKKTTITMPGTTKISLNPYKDVAVLKDGFYHFNLPGCFVV